MTIYLTSLIRFRIFYFINIFGENDIIRLQTAKKTIYIKTDFFMVLFFLIVLLWQYYFTLCNRTNRFSNKWFHVTKFKKKTVYWNLTNNLLNKIDSQNKYWNSDILTVYKLTSVIYLQGLETSIISIQSTRINFNFVYIIPRLILKVELMAEWWWDPRVLGELTLPAVGLCNENTKSTTILTSSDELHELRFKRVRFNWISFYFGYSVIGTCQLSLDDRRRRRIRIACTFGTIKTSFFTCSLQTLLLRVRIYRLDVWSLLTMEAVWSLLCWRPTNDLNRTPVNCTRYTHNNISIP